MKNDYEDICYTSNPIKEFIIRVDFAGILEELNNSLKREISEKLKLKYPIVEPKSIVTQQIPLGVTQGQAPQINKSFLEWNFYSLDRTQRICITANSIFFTTSSYSRFEDEIFKFNDVISLFKSNYAELIFRRCGMRYLNEITISDGLKPLDWSEYISDSLIKNISFNEIEGNLSKAISNLEYNFGEYQVRFQYGINNPDYPSVIKKKEFILDIDAYSIGLIYYEDISSFIEKFHSRIQSLFEASIVEKSRIYYGKK